VAGEDGIVNQPADDPSAPSRGLPSVGAGSEGGAAAVTALAEMFGEKFCSMRAIASPAGETAAVSTAPISTKAAG
jgi:hypothetical protein